MAYTAINKSSDYFNTKTYTGNGSSGNGITGVNFQPDWVWIKDRGQIAGHQIFDAVRGATKRIQSDNTSAEVTNDGVSSFDSDGFTLGSNSSCNENTQNFVAWNWLAGNGTSSNTDGSITSTVSANNTSGFSIVKYTGTGSAATVGHGLSTAPKVLLNKSISGTNDWFVGHSSIGFTKFLKLNESNAESTNSGIWNDTAPTSSVFTINSANGNTNSTGVEYITYCFSEVKGFSKFGSYTGNGSADGTFVYTGFKPAFLIIKPSSAIENWQTFDSKRPGYNACDNLSPNNTNAEETTSNKFVDLVSNGFKLRSATYSASSVSYIYMAFAEHPLVSSSGVPCTAR